jgi:hypothetical protein
VPEVLAHRVVGVLVTDAKVDVGVDEAGEHNLSFEVDDLAAVAELGIGTDDRDALAVDGDTAQQLAVRCYNEAPSQHQIVHHQITVLVS